MELLHKRANRRAAGAGYVYRSLLFGLALTAVGARGAGITTVRITDTVLQRDVVRLGINAPCPEWKRHAENFEGAMYRTIVKGPYMDATGIATWWEREKGLAGADFVVITGPAKGQRGKIKAVEPPREGITEGKGSFLTFDRPLTASPGKGEAAVLVERDAIAAGYVAADDKHQGRYALQQGDVPPGSYGSNALKLLGAQGTGAYSLRMRAGNANRLSFWARAVGGAATVKVGTAGQAAPDVAVGEAWARHEVAITAGGERGAGGVDFSVTGRDVLIDDVEVWTDAPGKYPRCHVTDAFVDTVKTLRPGILRELQMGGNTVHNLIHPPVRSHLYGSDFSGAGRKAGYGLSGGESCVAFYSLCEAVGADPWQCLPGTLYPDEMSRFIEFIAAPADVGLGKERAVQGHPEPYTKTFRRIYIEIGNEAWNPVGGYALGGFNGADYWKGLYAAAKASPHYATNIVLVAGSQQQNAGLTRRILADAPAADAAAIATYIVHNITPDWLKGLDTDDARFRWLFGWTVRSVADERDGYIKRQADGCRELGKVLTIYEHNYHMTKPTAEEGGVPYRDRNLLIASIGGGVNNVNHMLLALRDADVRAQCFFTLRQREFAGVRLWGALPTTSAPNPRPVFHALQLANRAIGGDLLATEQSGENPAFSATGVFLGGRKSGKQETVNGIPAMYSYAFRDGGRRGLILVSLDTSVPRQVEVQFDGAARGGKALRATLAADRITANNEGDLTGKDPEVAPPREETVDWSPGARLALPPFSLTAITWETP